MPKDAVKPSSRGASSAKGSGKGGRGKGGGGGGGDGDGADQQKKIKALVGVVIILGVAFWLLYYYEVISFGPPDPGPEPASFLDTLPEEEREATRRRIQEQQDMVSSGEVPPESRGQ
jgi:hypothetical protein